MSEQDSEATNSRGPTEDVVARANALKDEGNNLLNVFKYALAAGKYSEAIDLNPTAIFYSNRAQALIKLESYGLAIQDANEALKLVLQYLNYTIAFNSLTVLWLTGWIQSTSKHTIDEEALTMHWVK